MESGVVEGGVWGREAKWGGWGGIKNCRGWRRYAYESATGRCCAYFGDCGGATGPGGYTAKLDRAIKSNDTITLYQKVKKFDGEDGSNLAEEFELVYTFNIENDDYIFVSKVKKTD